MTFEDHCDTVVKLHAINHIQITAVAASKFAIGGTNFLTSLKIWVSARRVCRLTESTMMEITNQIIVDGRHVLSNHKTLAKFAQ